MKESQHTEWKASWRDDLLRYVCGFANADGGTLVIGRNDEGKLVGIPNATTLLTDLPNKIRDLLGVVAEVNLNSENGRDSIEIIVPAYPNPISYRGHYYQRSGSTLLELKAPLSIASSSDATAAPGIVHPSPVSPPQTSRHSLSPDLEHSPNEAVDSTPQLLPNPMPDCSKN
ncbi:MAG UNVERIFIED_CONTAM: ATP-binding protein [Planctomycetaceae bacterium]|jgi:predicted HTH transcriptional regulator